MAYDQLTEQLIEKYNKQTKVIEEGLPLALLGIASIGAAGAYVYKHGGIPENIKKLADESVLYQVLSIFDPTGVMSWPYVSLAYERLKKEPGDWWNNALFVLACFSTFPVVGIGARAITRLLTIPLRIPVGVMKAIKYIFVGAGNKMRSSSKIMEAYTQALAKGYSNSGKVVQTEALRRAVSKTMGVEVSDDAVRAIAAKSGLKLAKESGLASKLAKGAAAVGTAAVVGSKIARPLGRAARTFTAGSEAFNNKSAQQTANDAKSLFDRITSIKRTPVISGPKVKYGHIGGVVK